MPRVQWPLRHGRPCVEIMLIRASDGQPQKRWHLADSGAGGAQSGVELLLTPADCAMAGGQPFPSVGLVGAFSGQYAVYMVHVQIPALGLTIWPRVAGVNRVPPGFDGIACFRFLNRFTYGNFGDPNAFGLEL